MRRDKGYRFGKYIIGVDYDEKDIPTICIGVRDDNNTMTVISTGRGEGAEFVISLLEENDNLCRIVANKVIADYDIDTPLKYTLGQERLTSIAIEDALNDKIDGLIYNWNTLKQRLIDYRYKKSGSHEDGRYCVAMSITDILNLMDEIEKGGSRQ